MAYLGERIRRNVKFAARVLVKMPKRSLNPLLPVNGPSARTICPTRELAAMSQRLDQQGTHLVRKVATAEKDVQDNKSQDMLLL